MWLRLRKVLFTAELFILVVGLAQAQQAERFWIANRFDGNRVIVYFDAVKFNGTVPKGAPRIMDPLMGEFIAVVLPADYLAKYQKQPGAETFHLGDRYDLLTGDGPPLTVTLTELIGSEADEQVGNDSHIGALATLPSGWHVGASGHYAIRRHSQSPASIGAPFDMLPSKPLPFDIQTAAMRLLATRMPTLIAETNWKVLQSRSPRFTIQKFRLADGAVRYYAKAEWSPEGVSNDESEDVLGAWLAPAPLRILAVETRQVGTFPRAELRAELPDLRGVVNLGGKTGVIVDIFGEDSYAQRLLEYRDGASLSQMKILDR